MTSASRSTAFALAAGVVLAGAAGAADELGWTGNLQGFIGGKGLNHHDWDPVEGQGEIGILFDARPSDWPISLTAQLLGSSGYDKNDDTDVKTYGATSELQLGVKKIFGDRPGRLFHLWIGGGVDLVGASMKIDPPGSGSSKDHDSAVGGWAGGGVYWTIARRFDIGPMIEGSWARVTLFDRRVEAGGFHAGVNLGFHW